MREIRATLGYVVLVDDADYPALAKHRWYAHNTGGKGARHGKRPARRTSVAEGRKVLFLVHHLIRPALGLVVDHIDGNPWNNQRSNLRVCTSAQNVRNRAKHGGSCVNPYKGVYERTGRFLARICNEGALFNLGSYGDPEEAAKVYDAAALWLHGEFARLNFPDVGTVARPPEEIHAAVVRATHPMREAAILRLVDGERARPIAADLGVSVTSVVNWAAAAGITLTRGRPRIGPDPYQPAQAAAA